MIMYLMRHGIAVGSSDPNYPRDSDRPLTAEGVTNARDVARGLSSLGVHPTTIFTSPYRRAVETAEIVADVLGLPKEKIIHSASLEPGTPPDRLFDELSRIREDEVMCVGHAPSVDEIMAYAVGSRSHFTKFKKAGVACLEITDFSTPEARLQWLLPPSTLTRLGK